MSAGDTWPSPCEPVMPGAPFDAGCGTGAVVSHAVTFVTFVRPPPCSGQKPTGSVPAMNTSGRELGQAGVDGIPDSGSTSTETIPVGALNGFVSRYSRYPSARFMNSAQIGAAECAPSRLSSLLSSNPTHTTQSSSEV